MAYSQDLRDKVIGKYLEGYTEKKLSELFNMDKRTVKDWVERYKKNGDYSSKQGVGCGRVPIFSDKKAVLDYLEENPDANGIQIRDAVIPDLHMNTFYDTLARMGITYKKRAKI